MSTLTWPRRIDAFQTSDGDIHPTEGIANGRQMQIDRVRRANEMLQSGASVGVACRESGLVQGDFYHQLDDLFTTTKLVISHWQCRDQPGYSPVRFSEGGMFVHGDAGSWTGPYGADCSLNDLIRYWEDTKRRTGVSP